jgi:exosortase
MTAKSSTDPKFWIIVALWALTLGALLLIPLSTAWSLAPDLGHGWAAAILMVYLWWERWDERPAISSMRPGVMAWVFLIAASGLLVPLRLLLTPYPLWPMVLLVYLVGLILLLLVATWLLAGRAGLPWVAAPLIILLGVVPWPGFVERLIILPLREGVAMIVAEISNLLGHPALTAGTSVQLAHGWVGIDEACGGIRSLQAAVMTALFFGVWLRLKWSRRLALILVAGLAAVAGNFFRVLFLAGLAGGSGDALAAWHDPAGWAALGFSLGLTGWVGWLWRSFGQTPRPIRPVPAPECKAEFVRSLRFWFGISLICMIFTETGTRLWYARGAAEVRETVPQWRVNFPTATITYRALPLSEPAREMLRPDRFESGSWIGPDQLLRSAYLIEWQAGQVARSVPFLHNPTVCLPYAGCELVRELGVIQVRWSGGLIPFHTYVFRSMNEDMLVAFTVWDPVRGRELQDTVEGWGAWWQRQWRDVSEARQHQPAQLLAFAVMGGGEDHNLIRDLEALVVPSDTL